MLICQAQQKLLQYGGQQGRARVAAFHKLLLAHLEQMHTMSARRAGMGCEDRQAPSRCKLTLDSDLWMANLCERKLPHTSQEESRLLASCSSLASRAWQLMSGPKATRPAAAHPGAGNKVIQVLSLLCNNVCCACLPRGLQPHHHALALLQRLLRHPH